MNRQELRNLVLGGTFVFVLVAAMELLGRFASDAWARVNIYPDAVHPHYTISGTVRDVVGDPIPGVVVSDNAGHSDTTPSRDGAYTLSGVYAGTYIVTPVKQGFSFTPVSRKVIVPPSRTGQDFVGSGITELTGTPHPDVGTLAMQWRHTVPSVDHYDVFRSADPSCDIGCAKQINTLGVQPPPFPRFYATFTDAKAITVPPNFYFYRVLAFDSRGLRVAVSNRLGLASFALVKGSP